MIGIEIGDAEMADQAIALQLRQLVHGIEPGGMLERPPMELQEVDGRRLQAVARAVDGGADDVGRHRPRRRAPFGEDRRRVPAPSLAAPPATMRLKRPAMSSALP